MASGKPIRISRAPTRWGRVTLDMIFRSADKAVTATVELARPGSPKEIHVKLRLPKGSPLRTVTVNGQPATIGRVQNDTVIISTGKELRFEVVGRL
jgi:hypothetical protein